MVRMQGLLLQCILSIKKQGNKHLYADSFILTSMYTWHMGSRWYVLDLHIVTTDNLRTGPKIASNFVFQCRRKQCQMSIVRRWQLASHWCLLQIMSAGCFLKALKRSETLGPILPTRLVMVMALWLAGYWPPPLVLILLPVISNS